MDLQKVKNDGGPAFPCQEGPYTVPGMSLRDWFAGMALQLFREKWMTDGPDIAAEEAYRIADALLGRCEAIRQTEKVEL